MEHVNCTDGAVIAVALVVRRWSLPGHHRRRAVCRAVPLAHHVRAQIRDQALQVLPSCLLLGCAAGLVNLRPELLVTPTGFGCDIDWGAMLMERDADPPGRDRILGSTGAVWERQRRWAWPQPVSLGRRGEPPVTIDNLHDGCRPKECPHRPHPATRGHHPPDPEVSVWRKPGGECRTRGRASATPTSRSASRRPPSRRHRMDRLHEDGFQSVREPV